MYRKSLSVVLALLIVLSFSNLYAGTTGKIAGKVVDSQSKEPLAGVNVYLEGTRLGAATDVDGSYFIVNVPPGVYTLVCEFVGYAPSRITEVEVKIDLTTIIKVEMQSEIMTAEAVVVVAEKPVIQKDVAASQISVNSDEIQALPVTSIGEVVGLQAGVSSDFSIRGSGSDQTLFMVDGVTLRDDRNNQPIVGVPLSAVQEVSVQSGGFGAEYNNVRSGVVNLVTKEGDRNRYEGTVTYKIKPPTAKHFGISPYDPMSYWMRPYNDPAVMWTGTENGAWDEYTKRQYPRFDGWNKVSEISLQDDDPTNDLTPEAARRLFLWQHRKQGDIKEPDYYFDAGFGGPVPFVSRELGNLRFYASFQRERDAYMIELSRDALINQSLMVKLTSDISGDMKLSITGLYGEIYATSLSRSGGTTYFDSPFDIANAVDRRGFTVPWRIFTNIYWAPTSRYFHSFAAKLTHQLSSSSYYTIQLKRVGQKYFTSAGDPRDPTKKYEIMPGFFVDEAPNGFYGEAEFSVEGRLALGGAVSTSRDESESINWTARADLVSQIDKHNEIKTGLEITYNKYDFGFGMVNFFLPEGNTWTTIRERPFRAAFYLQDKIEYEGFIANLGLIADYTNSNTKWFNISDFDREFFSSGYSPEKDAKFRTADEAVRLTLSPRLSLSHPITERSKLYFNYGHYNEIPTSERLFRLQRDIRDKLDFIGDPNIKPARTISYELGYDQQLFDDYLLHTAAYYKDVTNQEFWVDYISFDGKVNYSRITNNSYEDIRGFEIELRKRRGRWLSGFANYEYRVGSSGFFGSYVRFENPADQRAADRNNISQSKPRPRPIFKANIDFHTPRDWGPKVAGTRILGGWHFNLLPSWVSGLWDTWNPNKIPGIQYNIQWNDFYNFELRISKTFPFENFDVKFFVDIDNLTNHKYFSRNSFADGFDYDFYMKSLHLPKGVANRLGYGNIPGDDNPGDYRATGAAFQPMEWISDVNSLQSPNERVIYYDASTDRFMQFSNGQWAVVPSGKMDKINEDKAYIDMPNQTYFTFLNPRSIFFGLSFTYHL